VTRQSAQLQPIANNRLTRQTQLHGAVRFRCPSLTCGPAIAPEVNTPVKGSLASLGASRP